MDYIKNLEAAGDELIDTVRAAQELTLSAVERAAKVAGGLVSQPALPLTLELPRPRELAESTFRFWQRVVENQRDFTLKLLGSIETTPKRAAKNG